MRLLGKEELKSLREQTGDYCVSLYMPAEIAGRETRMNAIRFKNLIGEVEKQLNDSDLNQKEIKNMLEPANELLNDTVFWQHQSEGLAAFFTLDNINYYRLPISFKEEVIINKRFYLKPLLPLFSGDGRFYVLALSQKNIRLLQASRYSFSELPLQDVPTSMEEALGYDNLEHHSQFHVASRTGQQRGDVMFHGHGGGEDNFKDDIQRYFQRVDKGLREILTGENAPMVIAGVDYLIPLYKNANSYENLLDDYVSGNPDESTSETLHQEAWKIVEPCFKQEQEKAEKQFQDLFHTGQTSQDIKKILPAAHFGKVGLLFLDVDDQKWGSFDPDESLVKIEKERQPGLEELIDLAAVKTLATGGTVYAAKKDDMPVKSSVAALFRWT
jgi:hypothetical protein